MKNIVIFGAPGSGKGTQSSLLSGRYGFAHISTGELLRAEMRKGTAFGNFAKQLTDNGQLVPDDLMVSLLSTEYDRLSKNKRGVIFDGYPRTLSQAETLNEMLAERGEKVTAMIELTAPEDELIERIVERGLASGRSDDTVETAKKRLEVYHKSTMPLIDFYKKANLHHRINGHGTIHDIFNNICNLIDSIEE
ncbi:MAG: adenylate kinase [Prevotella sp.]|nr:adenylate kinase [Prevotella sp.]